MANSNLKHNNCVCQGHINSFKTAGEEFPLWCRFRIQCCFGGSIGCSCGLESVPDQGTSIWCGCGCLKKKKKKCWSLHEALPWWPDYLQVSTAKYHHIGDETSTCEFWGPTIVQSVTGTLYSVVVQEKTLPFLKEHTVSFRRMTWSTRLLFHKIFHWLLI